MGISDAFELESIYNHFRCFCFLCTNHSRFSIHESFAIFDSMLCQKRTFTNSPHYSRIEKKFRVNKKQARYEMKYSFAFAVAAGAFKVLSGIDAVEGHDADDPQVSVQERLAGGTLTGLEGGNYARGLVVTSTPGDDCDQSTVLTAQCPIGYQVYAAKYNTGPGWEANNNNPVSVIVII
jgi:hypothetical protein